MKSYRAILLASMLVMFAASAAAGSIAISSVDLPASVTQGDSFSLSLTVSGSEANDVSGTVTTPTGLSCSPTGSQTISLDGSGQGTASWSCSADASGDYTNEITISTSATDSGTGGDLSDSTQDGLTVVAPASLTVSSSLDDSTITTAGSSTYTVSVHNTGGTSTSYSVSTSPGGVSFSVSSGSASGTIAGSGVKTIKYTVSSGSTGSYDLAATVSGGNGQTVSTSSTTLTVSSAGGTGGSGGSGGGSSGGSSGGGGGFIIDDDDDTADNDTNASMGGQTTSVYRPGLARAQGLTNNTKLQDAIEGVLERANLSDSARARLMELSAAIANETDIVRNASHSDNRTTIRLRMEYRGNRSLDRFMVYEVVPKSFAVHADNISVEAVGANVTIVKADPEYLFVYEDVAGGDSFEVSYDTETGSLEAAELDSLIRAFSTELYGSEAQQETQVTDDGREDTGEPIPVRRPDGTRMITVVLLLVVLGALAVAVYPFRGRFKDEAAAIRDRISEHRSSADADGAQE